MKNKEVIKKYKQLIHDVQTKEFYTRLELESRINIYTCNKGHRILTKDINAGVTPMFIICPECKSTDFEDLAKSSMYRVHPLYSFGEPDLIWYRPSLEDVLKMNKKKNFGELEHVLNGGLLNRKPNESDNLK